MNSITSRQDIDRLLPAHTEKAALRHLAQDGILEFVAASNTGFNEDGNWRLRLSTTDGYFYTEYHTGGSWVTQNYITP